MPPIIAQRLEMRQRRMTPRDVYKEAGALDLDVQPFLDRVHRGNNRLAFGPRLRRDGIDDSQEDVLRCRRRDLEDRGGREVVAWHLDGGDIERRANRPAL